VYACFQEIHFKTTFNKNELHWLIEFLCNKRPCSSKMSFYGVRSNIR